MKKKFKLQDLDCANCAAKMEDAINKMPEVESATVSFMMQKLTITCADEITKDFMKRMTQKMTIDAEDAQFEDIMKKVVDVCAKVEPDCRILM